MGSLSDYAELQLLDHVLGNGPYVPVATLYLGLLTAVPGDPGAFTEASGTGYARVAITFGAAGSRKITQNALVDFGTVGAGGWATVTHWGIFDAAAAGNILAWGAFNPSKTLNSGAKPDVLSGEIEIEFVTGGASDYLADIALDFMFRNQSFTPPTIYVALATVAIGDSDTGSLITEPSNNYGRVAHAAWDAAAAGASENTGIIQFPVPSGSWGTLLDMALLDAATLGNLLIYEPLDDQTNVPDNGDDVQFNDGDFDITLT